jgi:hypothetical protein
MPETPLPEVAGFQLFVVAAFGGSVTFKAS